MTRLKRWAELVFGRDSDAPPARFLWALLGSAVVLSIAGRLLDEDDEPNDLGGDD